MIFLNISEALNNDIKNIKIKPEDYLNFTKNLQKLTNNYSMEEGEEFNKNILKTFIKKSLNNKYELNTKGRIDLVIYDDNTFKSPPATLIEVKRPTNTHEMINKSKFNTKSLQELILYYLNERISNNNFHLKRLIITDSYNWYIFDAADFERVVLGNKELIDLYHKFSNEELSNKKTDFFYKNIASPFIENNLSNGEIKCLHFNIKNFIPDIENKGYSKKIENLRKVFSSYFLLKKTVPKIKN